MAYIAREMVDFFEHIQIGSIFAISKSKSIEKCRNVPIVFYDGMAS